MKRVAVFGSIAQFEAFVNDPKVSVIDIKVSTCEQSYHFQECFVGVVFYEDAPQNTVELAATDSQHTQHAIAALRSALSTLPVNLGMVDQILVAFELELQQHASA
jgi:hypothetical protein